MYGVTLYPDIAQYAVFAEFADGHKECVSGLYKIKANALKEAARKTACVKANYAQFKDADPQWAEEILTRRYYVVKLSYEEVVE